MASAGNEFGQKIQKEIADKTISYYAQQAKQRLEQDTPVKTGRLRASTKIQKDNSGQTLTQTAPYAAIVNERRQHFAGAVSVAQEWPQNYMKECQSEWGIVVRKYQNT